jgi:aryl-alcohol dehydrogenase-like predicted oxidoreductase
MMVRMRNLRPSWVRAPTKSYAYTCAGFVAPVAAGPHRSRLSHRQGPAVPVEEAIGALVRLQAEGKIGGIGVSAIDNVTFARAGAVTTIAAVQNEYSLLHREPERALLGAVADSATAFVTCSPLARGLLSGMVRSWPQQASDDYRRSDERAEEGKRLEALILQFGLDSVAPSSQTLRLNRLIK